MNVYIITFNLQQLSEQPELFTCANKVAIRLLEIAQEENLLVTNIDSNVLGTVENIVANLNNNSGLFVDAEHTPAFARCFCIKFTSESNTNDSFKEQSYEIAFGDNAINRGFSDSEALEQLRGYSDKAIATSKDKFESLRNQFVRADSISLGGEFYRYNSPSEEDDFEIVFTFDDERYEFSTASLDNAKYDGSCWSIYCDYNKQFFDVRFYEVKDTTLPVKA